MPRAATPKPCEVCEVVFKPDKPWSRFCSHRCANLQRTIDRKVWPSCRVYLRDCALCQTPFTGRAYDAVCCSKRCSRGYHYICNRQALIDNAGDNIKGLYRLAIVAGARPSRWRQDLHAALRFRDGDGCGICGYIIDFRLSGMLPGGPTIDHKVSRKNGGAHEWSNIHLTHRRCNSAKAARNLADYLAA